MAKIRIFVFLLLAALMAFGCSSNMPRTADYSAVRQDVRASLQEALDKAGTSVSYAVMQNGVIVVADAVGYLDAGKKTAATVDTLYNIGSLSKVYTAAAVMRLVDEGKIGLDDPVVKHLPDFKLKDSRYTAITVRMLLNHSSGMLGTDYTTGITYIGYDDNYYDKLRIYFEKSVLKADPGKFSVYCNDGFEVAELLVARVAGMPFDRYVAEKIFTPLVLSSTGYARRTFAPGSYAVMGSSPQEFPNVMGSGGVSTTLVDLARFGNFFLTSGGTVLKSASISEMNRPQGKTFIAEDSSSPGFGLGWDNVNPVQEDYDFGTGVLYKSGGTSQFTSYLYVIPRYNLSASISVTSDFSGEASKTLRDIIARVLRAQRIETARPAAVFAPPQPKPLPSGFEQEYAGYYGSYTSLEKVVVNSGTQTIGLQHFDGETFVTKYDSLVFDGQSFVKASGEKVYRFVKADGRRYMMSINEQKNAISPSAQKLESSTTPLGAWSTRMNRLFIPAEVAYDAVYLMSGMVLARQEGVDGVVFMQEGESKVPLNILDDRSTGPVLQIPAGNGRDLKTLTVETVNGEEWLANEAYSLRPVSSLADAASGTITIPESGANSLFRISSGKLTFTLPDKGRVVAYDQSGSQVYDSFTQGANFSLLPQSGFIRFVGPPGAKFTVVVTRS